MLTCAGLCLLQLQKLLQETAVVRKLVGNGRVVHIRKSNPETENEEGERRGLSHVSLMPWRSCLAEPKNNPQKCPETTECTEQPSK